MIVDDNLGKGNRKMDNATKISSQPPGRKDWVAEVHSHRQTLRLPT